MIFDEVILILICSVSKPYLCFLVCLFVFHQLGFGFLNKGPEIQKIWISYCGHIYLMFAQINYSLFQLNNMEYIHVSACPTDFCILECFIIFLS